MAIFVLVKPLISLSDLCVERYLHLHEDVYLFIYIVGIFRRSRCIPIFLPFLVFVLLSLSTFSSVYWLEVFMQSNIDSNSLTFLLLSLVHIGAQEGVKERGNRVAVHSTRFPLFSPWSTPDKPHLSALAGMI